MNMGLLQYFERPWLFLGLSIILLSIILFLYIRPKRRNFLNSNLLRQVYKRDSIWGYVFKTSLVLISFFSIVLISGLHTNFEKQIIKKQGIDIQIVMDMSYSMIAEDIKPRRIDVAKEMLSRFIGEIYSDRVGIILFSGKPFQSVPLTFDYDFLQDFISRVSVDIVSQSSNAELAGTALGDGLILASDILERENPEREKVIILITDGEANKGVEPELALRLLKENGIKTYTIGVGKGEETTINVPVGNFIQQILVGGVDEEILKKISYETGGRYFKADSSEAFQNILDTIAELEKTELEYEIYKSEKSQNLLFLCLIFILLCILNYLYFYKNIKI